MRNNTLLPSDWSARDAQKRALLLAYYRSWESSFLLQLCFDGSTIRYISNVPFFHLATCMILLNGFFVSVKEKILFVNNRIKSICHAFSGFWGSFERLTTPWLLTWQIWSGWAWHPRLVPCRCCCYNNIVKGRCQIGKHAMINIDATDQ